MRPAGWGLSSPCPKAHAAGTVTRKTPNSSEFWCTAVSGKEKRTHRIIRKQ